MVPATKLTVLIANPSPDIYGADLQMLESVRAFLAKGWRVCVALPSDGELVHRLQAVGAEVIFVRFPVLRRASASPLAVAGMLVQAANALPRILLTIRAVQPSVVYVNTVTLPLWLLASRLARRPALCHLHEAETVDRLVVRRLLLAPLRLAGRIVVISRSTLAAMAEADQALEEKAELIYNGVPGPGTVPGEARREPPFRAIVVGRLSPRKAPHLALEAIGRLRQRGYDLTLEIVGTPFEGYGWYEDQLRERAQECDLEGGVTFTGYRSPIWPALEDADVVVAPSLREPFGNAVVEAQLALRPVVATDAMGHTESIANGETGLLVAPGDLEALEERIAQVLDDRKAAHGMALRARRSALERFGVERYGQQICALVQQMASAMARGQKGPKFRANCHDRHLRSASAIRRLQDLRGRSR